VRNRNKLLIVALIALTTSLAIPPEESVTSSPSELRFVP
jgi:hypothetical protein